MGIISAAELKACSSSDSISRGPRSLFWPDWKWEDLCRGLETGQLTSLVLNHYAFSSPEFGDHKSSLYVDFETWKTWLNHEYAEARKRDDDLYKSLVKSEVTSLCVDASSTEFPRELSPGFYQAFPASKVTSLALPGYHLGRSISFRDTGRYTLNALFKALAASKVTSLDLSNNEFNQCPPVHWKPIGECLARTKIRSLHLRSNGLSQTTINEFIKIVPTLPTRISLLILFSMLDSVVSDHTLTGAFEFDAFPLVFAPTASHPITWEVTCSGRRMMMRLLSSMANHPSGDAYLFVDDLVFALSSVDIPKDVFIILDFSGHSLTPMGVLALTKLGERYKGQLEIKHLLPTEDSKQQAWLPAIQHADVALQKALIDPNERAGVFQKALVSGSEDESDGVNYIALMLLLNSFQASDPDFYWDRIISSLPKTVLHTFLGQLEKHLFTPTPFTSTILHWLIDQSQHPQGWFKLDKVLYEACIKALRENKTLAVALTSEDEADPDVIAVRNFQELLQGNTNVLLAYAGRFERSTPSHQIWLRLAAESHQDTPTAYDAAYQLGQSLSIKPNAQNEETSLCPYYWYRRVAAACPEAKQQLIIALRDLYRLPPLAAYHVAMGNVPRHGQATLFAEAFATLLKPGQKNWLGQISYTPEERYHNQQMFSYLQHDLQLQEEQKYQLLRTLKGYDINALMQGTSLADWYTGLERYAGKMVYRFMKEQVLPLLQVQNIKKSEYDKLKKLEQSQGLVRLSEQQRINLFAYEATDLFKSYDTSQGRTLFDKVIAAETQPLIIYHQIKTSLEIGLARYQLEKSLFAQGLNDTLNAHKQTLLQPSTMSQDSPVTCFGNTLYRRLFDYWACASLVETADITLKEFNSDMEQGKRSPTAGYQALAVAKKTLYGVAVVGELVSLILPYTKLFAELCKASGQVFQWVTYLHDNERLFFTGPAKGLHTWHFMSHLLSKGDPTKELQQLQKKALTAYRDLMSGLHATDADVFQVCILHYTQRYQPLLNQLTPQSAEQLAHILADLLFRGLIHQQLEPVARIRDIFSPSVGSKEFELLFERLDQVLWLSGLLPDEAYLVKRSGEVISVQQALFDVSLSVDGKPQSIALYAQDKKKPHAHPRQASSYEIKYLERELSRARSSSESGPAQQQVGLQLSAKTREVLKGKKLSIQPSSVLSLRQLYYRTEWTLQNLESLLFQYSFRVKTLSWVQRLQNYCLQLNNLVDAARYLHTRLTFKGFPSNSAEMDLEKKLEACIMEGAGLSVKLIRRAAEMNSSQVDVRRDLTLLHPLDISLPGMGEVVSIEQVEERLHGLRTRLFALCKTLGLSVEECFPGYEEELSKVIERPAPQAHGFFSQKDSTVVVSQKTQAIINPCVDVARICSKT